MADLNTLPLEDDFDTTLSQAWDGSTGTVYVNNTPSFTFPSGVTTYIVVNPGKSNMQVAEINAYDASAGTVTVNSTSTNSGAGTASSVASHGVGSVVRISDNFQFWEDIRTAINSKLDTNGGNADDAFDLATSGNSFRIRYDTGNMKFTDDNQAEVSLSTLASLSGVNDKVKISSNDTTEDYLDSKITGGDGVTVTETTDGGNETLDIDVDLTDTAVFSATPSATKAAVTGADGTVNALITYEYIGEGEYIFGDGSDGDVTISSNTTLTSDMYYNNLTIDNTFTLYPDGYKIYVKGTLTNNGTISRAGNTGTVGGAGAGGTGGSGGAGATALTGNTLEDSVAGGAGGAGASSAGGSVAGTAGTDANPSYTGTDGVGGGAGGDTASETGSAGGAGGSSTQGSDYNTIFSLSKLLSVLSNPASSKVGQLTSLLSDTLYKGPASAGGGGGGETQALGGGGGGGGGGGAGGTIWIAASTIDNTSGDISSIGGVGGAGGAGESGDNGGGGGGGGGNGGIIYLIYTTLTAIGTTTVTGGAGGAGGADGNGTSTTDGTAGTTGASGAVIQITV